MNRSNSTVKYSSPLAIQYILVTDSISYSDNEYHVSSFNLLRTLPIDLDQLQDSISQFEFSFKYKLVKGYEIFSLPSSFFNSEKEIAINYLKNYTSLFGVKSIVKVFLIDSKLNNHNNIAAVINNTDLYYYVVIGDDKKGIVEKYYAQNLFRGLLDFITIIKRDVHILNKLLSEHYQKSNEIINYDIKFVINPERLLLDQNSRPGAKLNLNNFFVLNQIIGNIWLDPDINFEDVYAPPEQRSIELIAQCKRIDGISAFMYNNIGIKPTDQFQPLLNTLVLISPYHYPKVSLKFPTQISKQEKKWLSVLYNEQNLNYQNLIEENVGNEIGHDAIKLILNQNFMRLNYLDSIAFLHSMFTYSPVIRLPQIGKSINLELSHLEKITTKKHSTINNITKFGRKLSSLILSENVKKYIKNRNGQIFAISDLPLEWLYLEDYPLCFTHDVCRLPEFNLNSLVNNAIHLQRGVFEIPDNLINTTLIIHCASPNDVTMNAMFDLIDTYKEKQGFISVRCSTIENIKLSIERYKPDLLIFDCHGASDRKELSSFLIVDAEKKVYLTGNDIVKFNISAPLVFLSACETFPNYGYVKLLSDAFMQAGSFCVTTTFLQIKAVDATILILRLLNNLNQLKSKAYHMNWLNFLSHVLRSTLIHETINKSRSYFKEDLDEKEIALIVTKSMRFENRVEALSDLDRLLEEKSSKQISFNQLDNDWLSYSIIGRADLIYFKNWLKSYRDINVQ